MGESFSTLRARYQQWAHDTFGERAAAALQFDEAGFPDWSEVESLFADLMHSGRVNELSERESSALLFLIARSWDLGRMIAWLSTSQNRSNLGPLRDADVVFLAQRSLELVGAEYDDARYQIAAILPRVHSERERAIELLNLLCSSEHEYTQRIARKALAELREQGATELRQR